MGRPIQVYDDKGELVWQVEFDIYGRIREDTFNNQSFIPFRQLGQYEDKELDGLYYNRFRYYDSHTATYISQDPIRLEGNNPNFYAYVCHSNTGIDPLGLFFVKIIGNAQTTGTFGHSTISKIIANIYSIDQRVQRVTMDLCYKKLLGGGNFKYGPRPDVGVLYKNERVKIIEIASKTDKINDLISRNKNFMHIYNIDCDFKVNRLAQFIEKVKSKFKIKRK